MAKVLTAEAVITASDKTGATFNAVANKMRRMTDVAGQANRRMGSAARYSDTMARSAERTSRAIMAPMARFLAPAVLGYAGVSAVRRFAETELAITRIGLTADATDAEIAAMYVRLRELAFATGKSFNEVSTGLGNLVAGGMDLKTALISLPAIAKTAQASGATVDDMASSTLALQQNLGISAEKMQAAFDILVAGGKAGKFELKDMARYLPSIAPAAVALGLHGEAGLKKIVAMLQTVRQGTGTVEEAASSVQNIFAKMESEQTGKRFAKFGINLRSEMAKARKEGKDLLGVFIELTQRAVKGDLSKIPQLFTDMEFARGMRALMAFRDTMADVLDRLEKAQGSTQTDFNRVMKVAQVRTNQLSEAFDRAKNAAGSFLDTVGTTGALQKMAVFFETAATHLQKPPEQRQQEFAEAQRRGRAGTQLHEVEQKIQIIEHSRRERLRYVESIEADAERERFPGARDRLRARAKILRDRIGPEDPLLNELRFKRLQLQFDLAPFDPAGYSADDLKRISEEAEKAAALERRWNPPDAYWMRIPLPRPDPRRGAGPLGALDAPAGAVKAELSGSAEVSGEATVRLDLSDDAKRLLQTVDELPMKLRGMLRNDGPGSTGQSMPEALPGGGGAW